MPTITNTILQAARQRFSDYGPCKTTMAEIAKDCGMSVGNLYRHFDNKNAIMLASLEQQLQEKLDAGIAAASQQEDSLEALRSFLQTRLAIGYAQFAGTRHLLDLLVVIQERHHDVLLSYEQKVIEAMAVIVLKAHSEGRFQTTNALQTAYDIHQATLRYNNPMTLQHNKLEKLAHDLNRLIDLLYIGLKKA